MAFIMQQQLIVMFVKSIGYVQSVKYKWGSFRVESLRGIAIAF